MLDAILALAQTELLDAAKYGAGPAGTALLGWQIVRWLLRERSERVPREAHAALQAQCDDLKHRLAAAEAKRDQLLADLMAAIRGLEATPKDTTP